MSDINLESIAKNSSYFYQGVTPSFNLSLDYGSLAEMSTKVIDSLTNNLSSSTASPTDLAVLVGEQLRKSKSNISKVEQFWPEIQKKLHINKPIMVSPKQKLTDLPVEEQMSIAAMVFVKAFEYEDEIDLALKLEPHQVGPMINATMRNLLALFKEAKSVFSRWKSDIAASQKTEEKKNLSQLTLSSDLKSKIQKSRDSLEFRYPTNNEYKKVTSTVNYAEKRIAQIIKRYNDFFEDLAARQPEWKEVKNSWSIHEDTMLQKDEYKNPAKRGRINLYA